MKHYTSRMHSSVAWQDGAHQVLLGIPLKGAEFLVVHFTIRHRATRFTPPAVGYGQY